MLLKIYLIIRNPNYTLKLYALCAKSQIMRFKTYYELFLHNRVILTGLYDKQCILNIFACISKALYRDILCHGTVLKVDIKLARAL